MSNNHEFDYSVLHRITDENDNVTGVIIQVDNGDTQYLTIEEYMKLVKK